jgi:UDPglucose 6-dehydrogenase
MKVAVVGTGHVGLITCVSLASVGHEVVGNDADVAKIEALTRSEMPFYEPGVPELLEAETRSGRLRFTTSTADAVEGADVVFICVGTPARATGEANLVAVETAAREVARCATGPVVIADKSTVPAGTARRLQRLLASERRDLGDRITVVSNPEFLREGRALSDALEPDRILVGAPSGPARDVMRKLYRTFIDRGVTYIETDIATAELAKHACNVFLSMKISYANALARICDRAGGDVEAIADVMGADPRIGRDFLGAGLGYGGYCFPKDLVAFEALARELGYSFPLLREVARINDEAIDAAIAKISEAVWNLDDKRIAVLGLAFKPGTDDVRFSPALSLCRKLMEAGSVVVGYDPVAGANAKAECETLELAESVYDAAAGADCLVIAAGWTDFRDLDFTKLSEIMVQRVVVDARNFLDPQIVIAAGLDYYAMGRPAMQADPM